MSLGSKICCCALVLAFAAHASAQTPASTAFTYQGQLKNGGSPANGLFNMAFKLFDAATLGNHIGPTLSFGGPGGDPTPITVANGLFTVQLDFGVNAYTANQALWLEIAINGTTLSPRQSLTPTPFALNTRGLNVDAGGNLGIGTAAQAAQLHVVGNGPFPHARIAARDDSSTPYGAFFSLDATPTTGGRDWWLFSTGASAGEGPGRLVFENISEQVQAMVMAPGGNIGLGTTSPGDRLSINGGALSFANPFDPVPYVGLDYDPGLDALRLRGNIGSGSLNYTAMAIQRTTGNVGVGTTAPQCRLDVKGRAYVDPNNFGGAPAISLAVGDTDTGLNSAGDGALDLYSNGNNTMSIRSGNVGIGTTSPANRLSVAGNANFTGNVGIGTTAPGVRLDVFSPGGHAVRGTVQLGGDSDAGIYGVSVVLNGTGLIGECNNGTLAYGVWGKSSTGDAGHFDGHVQINGSLSKSAGSFKIDHPLDPDNKYLYHSFVESPDMKNIYDGIATLDALGQAVIELPDWFSALNRDFRYQLTAIGAPGPNLFIAQEVSNNHFTIAGGKPGMKVSWMVTGIRHDAYADAHRIPVEVEKSASERGRYLHPDLFGKPPELSVSKHPPAPADATAHDPAQ